MKKVTNILYCIRIILFIMHLLMLFTVLNNIVDVGLIGYLFLIIDSIYVIRVIFELLSQKKCYKNEIYYNIMQIGLFIYIIVLWYKLYFDNTLLTKEFFVYLKTNYIILIILIAFLLFYSKFGINNILVKKNSD